MLQNCYTTSTVTKNEANTSGYFGAFAGYSSSSYADDWENLGCSTESGVSAAIGYDKGTKFVAGYSSAEADIILDNAITNITSKVALTKELPKVSVSSIGAFVGFGSVNNVSNTIVNINSAQGAFLNNGNYTNVYANTGAVGEVFDGIIFIGFNKFFT